MDIEKFIELKEKYMTCTKCPELVEYRTQVVFGSGNPKSKILFLGEAAGANEDRQGIPFCGMSGKVLNELLESVALSREDIFITNTILCRPPNNRNPKKEEMNNCGDRLSKLISIMKPRVIVTIGNFATGRILGKTGITSLRGNVFPLRIAGVEVSVVPVVHPASYLYSGRNPEMFKQMSSDFKVIADIVKGKKEQAQLGDF
tara:strand:+ start:11784 stop:12389 length:606 start_codon:yes stop_codon:yes gene_type:complete